MEHIFGRTQSNDNKVVMIASWVAPTLKGLLKEQQLVDL